MANDKLLDALLHLMAPKELHSAAHPGRLSVDQEPGGPSMTRQEFSDECDINKIMERYEKNGVLDPRLMNREPLYVDFTRVPTDLQSAMGMMLEADEAFGRLPASVRKEFDNDAFAFVDFASSPDNIGKLREWGLAPPEPQPAAPVRVEVVGSTPTPSPASPAE